MKQKLVFGSWISPAGTLWLELCSPHSNRISSYHCQFRELVCVQYSLHASTGYELKYTLNMQVYIVPRLIGRGHHKFHFDVANKQKWIRQIRRPVVRQRKDPGRFDLHTIRSNCILAGIVENRKAVKIDQVKDVGGNEKCKPNSGFSD